MRFKLHLSPNETLVPFVNQEHLNGAIHKWLGRKNKYHDDLSNYSISGLLGGKQAGEGLKYEKGFIVASSPDIDFLSKLIRGISIDPIIDWGMKVVKFEQIKEDVVEGKNLVFALSPIFLKERISQGEKRIYTYEDIDANEYMTRTLKHKIQRLNPNINLDNFRVEFSNSTKSLISRSIKRIVVHEDETKKSANQCPIMIYGSKEAAEFCLNIGIGKNTGSGFGCITTQWERFYN